MPSPNTAHLCGRGRGLEPTSWGLRARRGQQWETQLNFHCCCPMFFNFSPLARAVSQAPIREGRTFGLLRLFIVLTRPANRPWRQRDGKTNPSHSTMPNIGASRPHSDGEPKVRCLLCARPTSSASAKQRPSRATVSLRSSVNRPDLATSLPLAASFKLSAFQFPVLPNPPTLRAAGWSSSRSFT